MMGINHFSLSLQNRHIFVVLTAAFFMVTVGSPVLAQKLISKGLKTYYKDYFPIGVAVSPRSLNAADEVDLILREFNSITPENAMKMAPMHPREDVYNWRDADNIVAFAQKNKLKVRGHTLCWHEQAPSWMFVDSAGQQVSKELLLKRLKDHIFTIVKRYKGKIYAWDVVNEAIDDNPEHLLRKSKWLEICGEEFIEKAFQYAHEADPDALLFYNDYNTERPEKRERIYKLLKRLVDKGVPVHGVGLQAHWSIYEPSEAELRKAIEQYSSLGLQIHFTELDVSVYPWEKERRARRPGESDVYTAELQRKQADQYRMFFRVFREYKKVVTSVTFWNISDRTTWLDMYPVRGRKNYPLLFDTQLKPKEVYWDVVKF